MKIGLVITLLIMLAGGTSVKISNTPPDLTMCSQLGWAKSQNMEIETANDEMRAIAEREGGNFIYLLPVNVGDKNVGGIIRGGIIYKCN